MGRPRTPRGRARLAAARLAAEYPDADCALDFDTPWQLLVATILSAQCTDERVNMVTPALFERFPDAGSVVPAPAEEIEELVKSTGFFRNKTKSIKGAALAVEERFGGEVPARMEDLVTIPGVGRKTANVLLHVAFAKPGIAVDTHVQRLVHRIGITAETDPVKIEFAIYDLIPKRDSGLFGMRLILHGRQVCKARKPDCASCVLADFCPSAFTF
ncbi:MAG: endonuclease III [Acidimicrobiia bacterium]|nr:endonuclease III [Acidimicrobiia bacterium]